MSSGRTEPLLQYRNAAITFSDDTRGRPGPLATAPRKVDSDVL
jgi:hypothetical protein